MQEVESNNTIISKNKKVEEYELTALIYSYLNDEVIREIVQVCESEFKDLFNFQQSTSIGRYDVIYKKKKIKVNMYTIIFIADKSIIAQIKTIVQNNKTVIKFLLMRHNYKVIQKLFNYKYPIEMKKYMFESMRLMPIELTKCTAKEQKILAINMQRARNLGLIDRSK